MRQICGQAMVLAALIFSVGSVSARQTKENPAAPKQAASSAQDPLHSLFHTQHFGQVAISPDGKKVAWVEIQKDKNGAETGKHDIYIAEVQPATKPMRITAAGSTTHSDEHDLAWSPDSKQLAFLSDAGKAGQLQLYVSGAAGLAPRKLTNAKGLLAAPQWSPDGKSIALLYTENATRPAGPLMPETPENGVIKDAFFEQRLAIVDATGGALHFITPDDTYIYEYDWAPDSKTLVMSAAKGNGDNNWWVAQLYTLNVTEKVMHAIYKPKLQIARPEVSPDGKNVAFIEGLMSDEDSVGGDVFLVSMGGGSPQRLTPRRKASASVLAWTRDGKLLDMENADGESSISRIDPQSGAIEDLYHAPEMLSSGFWATSLAFSADGATSAAVRSSFGNPPEVYAGAIGKWTQLTHRNEGLKPAWGEAKSVHWKNGGFDIQGWLVYPRDFDSSKKYPMIVSVHGGPGYAIQAAWPSIPFDNVISLPSRGYFLFQPNPRGSFGRGEEFTQANVRDFGYGDWHDVMSGVDEVIKNFPVDPQRLGLTGWSYGGYMTMWGVTQTNRFRAAVAGAGIANWSRYYGEKKIDQWMIPFFGKSFYDDPEVYNKSAPLTFIKNVKTPTLIVVGDSDGECPTPQSYEFWHALKTLGVETEFVVYEHEGHMFIKPADVRDVIKRMGDWFDAHLR
jgi:dipeptidyl aminopeptidase/acylaminoacyl peptidase